MLNRFGLRAHGLEGLIQYLVIPDLIRNLFDRSRIECGMTFCFFLVPVVKTGINKERGDIVKRLDSILSQKSVYVAPFVAIILAVWLFIGEDTERIGGSVGAVVLGISAAWVWFILFLLRTMTRKKQELLVKIRVMWIGMLLVVTAISLITRFLYID